MSDPLREIADLAIGNLEMTILSLKKELAASHLREAQALENEGSLRQLLSRSSNRNNALVAMMQTVMVSKYVAGTPTGDEIAKVLEETK